MSSFWEQVRGAHPDSNRSRHELVKTYISLASLLVAAIGISVKDLPAWATAAIGVLIAILLGLICWNPLKEVFAKWRDSRVAKKVAKKFSPDVKQFLDRFVRELSDSNSNTLAYEIRSLYGIRDSSGVVVVDSGNELQRMVEWILLFRQRVERNDVQEFDETLKALNLVAVQYWQYCYMLNNRICSCVAQNSLSETDLKKVRVAWNSGREGVNRILLELSELFRRIGQESGSLNLRVDYQLLKSVE